MDSTMRLIFHSWSATKYGAVASVTFLVWDMLLTFDIEVSRIWQAKRSLITILFLLNRYVRPATAIFDVYSLLVPGLSSSFCKIHDLTSTTMTLFSIAVIEAILITRTHALYQNRFLLFTLLLTGVATMGAMFASSVVLFQHKLFLPSSEFIAFKFTGCLSACNSNNPLCRSLFTIFWIPFWTPLLFLESLIFALTIWKSYKSFTTMKTIKGNTTIIEVLTRDGILYYAVIMSASLLYILLWYFVPSTPGSYLAMEFMKNLQACMCSRLLLNLRGIAVKNTTPSIVLERVLDRRAAARAVEQRFQSNPRALV